MFMICERESRKEVRGDKSSEDPINYKRVYGTDHDWVNSNIFPRSEKFVFKKTTYDEFCSILGIMDERDVKDIREKRDETRIFFDNRGLLKECFKISQGRDGFDSRNCKPEKTWKFDRSYRTGLKRKNICEVIEKNG